MKFTATLAEIEELVRLKYDLTDDVKFEISDLPHRNAEISISTFMNVMQCVNFSTDKITAIKMVRTFLNCGLAEGKWIVENWYNYTSYLVKHNKHPRMTFEDGGYRMI